MATNNPLIEITLETMAYGGSALGKHAGRVIFVPYSIPGETITARITQDKGRIAFAEGITLLDPSLDRVPPRCAHFGPRRCGGCHWQHITYGAQLLLKQDVLADQLERVGGFTDPDVRSVVPSPDEWGYQHALTFLIGSEGGAGLRGTDSDYVGIEVCEVLHPDLLPLLHQLDIGGEGIGSVRLIRGGDGDVMLLLYADEEDAPELELDIPASINLTLPDNEPMNLAGNTHVRYEIGGKSFRVTAGSAFRANVPATLGVVQAVLAAVGSAPQTILDLYAGVGLFAAFLAEQAAVVTVVESFPPAATDADENLADYEHVDVIEGTVEDVLLEAEPNYDAAVVNPPGQGLSIEAIDALAALNIPVVVYVSSDAATFARDAKRLVGHGYALEYVQPLDVAPHAYYTEIVARFTRDIASQRPDEDTITKKAS